MLPWIQQFIRNKKTVTLSMVCLVAVFLFLGLSQAVPVSAQQVVGGTATDTFGLQPLDELQLGKTDIRITIARIVRALFAVLGIIAVGLIIYAGVVIMTSGGNEDKIGEGKKVLVNAVIGLIIIFSALAIVQFILNALSDATGRTTNPLGGRSPQIQSFSGSGALGRIVKDHSPVRDEINVWRNTKIAVTFREAMDPASFIVNRNQSGVVGDCLMGSTSSSFDWARDCDRLSTSSVRIYKTGSPNTLVEAAALAVYDQSGKAYTFVFKPLDGRSVPEANLFGSETTSVKYTVDLTGTMKKADGRTSAFVADRDGHYSWSFETTTTLDNTMPQVTSVYPSHNPTHDTPVPKNSLIQVNFNEAMDPVGVQGLTNQRNPSSTFYTLVFGNDMAADKLPQGQWSLSNGYKTLEFVPNDACGQNSCGDIMYCLPLACTNPADARCRNDFHVLIRTGDLLNPAVSTTFEGYPGSGALDLAGNVLDTSAGRNQFGVLLGDGRLANPHKPGIGNGLRLNATENVADNYWWEFTVENRIDRTPPQVQQVSPGLDEESVAPHAPLLMTFNRVMSSYSLVDVSLEEFPAGTNGVAPIWFDHRVELVPKLSGGNADTTLVTRLEMNHRMFGPNQADLYYFPSIPSSVKSITQNCLYPGRGPIAPIGQMNTSPICQDNGTYQNCIAFDPVASSTDTGCIQTTKLLDQNGLDILHQPNVGACLSVLRREDISPPPTTTDR